MIEEFVGGIFIGGIIQTAFWYFEKRSYTNATLKLQSTHKAEVQRLQKQVAEYREIAESHTVTWNGFEPDEHTPVFQKVYTNLPDDILRFIEADLQILGEGDFEARIEIHTKGPWTTHLNNEGWGTGEGKTRKSMKPSQWTLLDPCTTSLTGSIQQILAGIQSSLKSPYFYFKSSKEWKIDANLRLVLEVEKKIPRERPKPKVQIVEIKIAVPQEIPIIDRYQREEEERRRERASLIAAELEIDPDLRNAVLQVQTRVKQ